ncbi:phosphoesterase [Bacilli bacterium]|nr:phosphoesterase [Bacilli bacterium]GHU46444.1 phosphoesterase [Bacilli bacterium]
MKTIVVGDLHLQGTHILPLIDKVIAQHKIERVVLLGDYFDQWGQNFNSNLYEREVAYLKSWVLKHREQGLAVILLIGNHDAPYLLGLLRHYSISDASIVNLIKETLLELGVQLCIEVEDYLISHAGFAGKQLPEKWYFEPMTLEKFEALNKLENTVGYVRGGRDSVGSLLWADYKYELTTGFNEKYAKQIVGHTPVSKGMASGQLWGMDTFSLYQDYRPIGNGDVLLIENGTASIIATDFVDEHEALRQADKLFK